MGSKVVRVWNRDLERVCEMSGMADGAPFSYKLHAVLLQLDALERELLAARSLLRRDLLELEPGRN
ncbi:MAG TPA: hypothetical protein VGR28_02800 [Candidatus Thermoplasmatota archaeon]|jgi:hypothetical protein|nr:hypothetical protein [Candidatus Thermoplasmatota archaeon]